MSLQSPLGRALGLGSAKEGSGHWYAQRLTAVALALLGTWFLLALVRLDGLDLVSVRTWLRSPVSAALLLLLVTTLAWHTILGLQVVIEDYVSAKGLRVALVVAMKFAFVLAAAAGGFAVLSIALGMPA